jgi:hypothetical protein
MRGLRAISAGGTVLAAVLLAAVSGAAAGADPAPRTAARTGAAALGRLAAAGPTGAVILSRLGQAGPTRPVHPDAVSLNDRLNGNSCTPPGTGSPAKPDCLAIGFFESGATIQPLALGWPQGGPWASLGPVPNAAAKNQVNLPAEISCAARAKAQPACLMVGEHYRDIKSPAQLAEVWTGTWKILSMSNPPGTTWSSMEDVSCRTATFCMMTGEAGTTKQSASGTVFISHATAYTWDGTKVTRLAVPNPPSGHDAELAGVSCPTVTTCLAVGNYTRPDGRSQAYSARWSGGRWTVQNARNLTSQVLTLFESVACVSTTRCEAVGTTLTPGSRAFAEAWTNGTWQTQPTASQANATLFGVTCPAAGRCFAAGSVGSHSMIEAWNGTRWSVQPTPGTAAPRAGSALTHVSCVTASLCEAVGYRLSRSRADIAPHTLAVGWDGSRWQIQPTPNQ